MDSCPPAAQLERLLADRLAADDCARVSAHVEGCRDCQQRLEDLTRPVDDGPRLVRPKSSTIVAVIDAPFVRRMENLPPPAGDRSSARWVGRDSSTAVGSGTVPSGPATPVAIPGFEILAEIGRGGMAVVYKARQASLKRLVALKVILAGAHVGEEKLARFRAEAEAVARLRHPGIVQIYETGEHLGVPYLVLEYVDGGSLAQKTRDKAQPPRAAAALVETLADAVDAAHREGIIHRDLKPTNILLSSRFQVPSSKSESSTSANLELGTWNLEPKISDFGLAMDLADASRQTRTGEVVGTPSYMAPEQAQGRRKDFGPATDVHALGAVLYELLTGRPPFHAATAVDTLVQVSFEDPIPPSRLRADLPRDLETICLKCLQKDPRHRYQSARALATDLRRFLNHEPIEARPTTLGGRVIKWARRRPVIAGLAVISLVLTAVSLLSLGWALAEESSRRSLAEANERRETDLRHQAQQERLRAERLSAAALLDQAISQADHGHMERTLLLLVQSLELANRAEDADLERAARLNLTAWRRLLIRQRATLTHLHWISAVAYSPDGQTFVTASRDKTAQLWSTATGRPVGDKMAHDFPVWAVAFSPDGQTLATASGEGGRGDLRLWDARTGKPLGEPITRDFPTGHTFSDTTSLAFTPDGRTLLGVGGGRARLWKLDPDGTAGPAVRLPHPRGVMNAVLSPDGSQVLTGGADGTARLWSTASGRDLGVVLRHDVPENSFGLVFGLAYSPDGRTIATGLQLIGADGHYAAGEVRLWRVAGEPMGEPIGTLAHRGPVRVLAFSPDGRRLLSAGMIPIPNPKPGSLPTGEARLWDVETVRPIGRPIEQARSIWAAAFSPDGRTVLTGCEEGSALFWVAATGLQVSAVPTEPGNVTALAFAPDGRTAVTGRTYVPANGQLCEVPPGRGTVFAPVHTGPIRSMSFADQGRILLTAGGDGQVVRWDHATGRLIGAPLRHDGLAGLSVTTHGSLVATVGSDRVARLWDPATGQPVGDPIPHGTEPWALALSPDGTRVLTGGKRVLTNGVDHSYRLWDRRSGRPVGDPFPPDGFLIGYAFSADGSVIATAGDGGARMWDAATGKPISGPVAHARNIQGMALSPDGKLLATSGGDAVVRLWDVRTGQPVGPPLAHRSVGSIAFSPDSRVLLTGSHAQTAWLWDVATGTPLGPPLSHRAGVTAVSISPDGRTAATVSADKTVRLWDVATSHQLGPPLEHPAPVTAIVFAPDGRRLFTAGDDGLVRAWDLPVPATGDVAHLRQWVEALTGMQIGGQGGMRQIDDADLSQRRQAVEQLGPEPFAIPANPR
jgi:WD40 repeat protein/serine/threonine protein kinase